MHVLITGAANEGVDDTIDGELPTEATHLEPDSDLQRRHSVSRRRVPRAGAIPAVKPIADAHPVQPPGTWGGVSATF